MLSVTSELQERRFIWCGRRGVEVLTNQGAGYQKEHGEAAHFWEAEHLPVSLEDLFLKISLRSFVSPFPS